MSKYKDETQYWIKEFIVRHNICPFAEQVLSKISYTVCSAQNPEVILEKLVETIQTLLNENPQKVATAFLILPKWDHNEFEDFCNLVGDAEDLLATLAIEDEVQLVAFHPRFHFAGESPDDVTNAVNQSPHAMIHLLRSEEVATAVDSELGGEAISLRNKNYLRRLGNKALLRK